MSALARSLAALALASSVLLAGCGAAPAGAPHTPTAAPGAPASPAGGGTAPQSATPVDATPAPGDPAPANPDPAAPGTVAPDPAAPGAGPAPALPVPPQPAPPASSTAPPPLATLTLSPRGLGTLLMGAPLPDPHAPTSMVRWDPVYCAEFPHMDGSTGAFLPAYPPAVSPALGERPPFTLMTTDGNPASPLASLIVLSPEVRTAEGIGVGSGRSLLSATYPAFADTRTAQLSDVFVLDGPGGRLIFEVANAVAAPLEGYWEPAVVDTVLWMRIAPPGAEPMSIAGSDAGGPCPV